MSTTEKRFQEVAREITGWTPSLYDKLLKQTDRLGKDNVPGMVRIGPGQYRSKLTPGVR